jgi:hypothetical protein
MIVKPRLLVLLLLLVSTGFAVPKFRGLISFGSSGNFVNYTIDQIYNDSAFSSTGTIRVSVYGSYFPYTGVFGYGTFLYSALADPLLPNYAYNNLTATVVFNFPPSNFTYLVVLLEEYTFNGYRITDYVNLPVSAYFPTYYTGPAILTSPSSRTITPGSAHTFSVVASGSQTLTYQWRKNGIEINGATSSTYSISSTSVSDSGSYTVVVTNSAGSATSNPATLTVIALANAPAITLQPSSVSVTSGARASFSVVASGTATLAYQWRRNGSAISGATSSTYSIGSTSVSDSGSYTVVVTNSAGSATSNSATLAVAASATAPTITLQPSSISVTTGAGASFEVVASGTAPLTYQWKKDGTSISGATSLTYTISSNSASDSGSYTVIVTNSAGSATSNSARLTVTAPATAPRLFNLSVRAALDANQIAIVGFTMSGGAKNVLLRAAGPTLSLFQVPGVMADPKLDLYSGSSRVSTNDNWAGQTTLSAAFASVGAFPYSSTTSLDAALVSSIDGGRTVQVYGPTAGTVLIEAYDAGTGDSQRFTNLSARNKVGVGANILIAGFTLEGSGTRNLLIRAVGPKLTDFNVSGVLADPKLEIYSGTTKLYENDNWLSSLSATFASVGAFALNTGSKDAAITVALPSGGYTVHVSGADGGIGEAIVEIYELP